MTSGRIGHYKGTDLLDKPEAAVVTPSSDLAFVSHIVSLNDLLYTVGMAVDV